MAPRGLKLNISNLFFILIYTPTIIGLSSHIATNNSTSINANSSATLEGTTTTGSEILFSGNEFVDLAEMPTLLFDGTSNDNDTTPNTSASPPPIKETIPQTNSSKEQTSILSPDVVGLESETTTSTSTYNSSSVTTLLSREEETETTGTDDNEDDSDENKRFEPPQNVSEYMDYIERLSHDLRHQITDLFEPHLPQLIRTSQMVQLSGSCSYDMLRMALALRQFEPWALRMIDSSGKMPEGIFEGSFTALGSYDECLNTVFGESDDKTTTNQVDSDRASAQQTQGKYCLVNVSPYLPPKPPADRVERVFQEEANRRNYTKDNQFSSLSPMFYYIKFRIGICIPSTCVDSDMESLSDALSKSLRLNITIPHCRIKQNHPITNHQLAGGLIFATIVAIVLGSTLMDYSGRIGDQKRGHQVILSMSTIRTGNDLIPSSTMATVSSNIGPELFHHEDFRQISHSYCDDFFDRLRKHWSWMSFSLLTNHKLHFEQTQRTFNSSSCDYVNIRQAKDDRSGSWSIGSQNQNTNNFVIKCLNGIRVISLCWVIVANSYITLDPRATKRLTKTREAPKDFLFQVVAQASLAIETFFFLSGVLMSLSYARKLRNGRQAKNCDVESTSSRGVIYLRWLQFYVHRYIRMTPATMLVIAITMYAFRFGDGPLWFEATHKAHQSCSKNWWRHLLHIANFIDTRQMCFIHYWYISADMQLFLFAPVIMFLIYRYRKVGYTLVALIGLASMGSIFYTTYMLNLPPTLLFYNSDPESRREFGNTIMTKPLTHALPYLVGMLVGRWLIVARSQPRQNNSHTGSSSDMRSSHRQGGRSLMSLFGAIATIVALAEVFLPYKWNNSHLPTQFLASLYAALFRFAWSLVLAFIIVSCGHRRGMHCSSAKDNVNDQKMATTARQSKTPSSSMSEFSSTHLRPYHYQSNQSIYDYDDTTINNIKLRQQKNQQRYLNSKFTDIKCDHRVMSSPSVSSTNTTPMMMVIDSNSEMCFCGSGGNLVNRLLSLDVFTYLSKLSFVAYLIHLPLMSVFIAQTRGLFAFSHTLVIHLALSYLVMTFVLSFILVHVIELPFLTFERYLFEKLLRPNSSRNVHNNGNNDEIKTNFSNGSKTYISSSSGSNSGSKYADTKQPKMNSFMSNKLGSYNINGNKELAVERL